MTSRSSGRQKKIFAEEFFSKALLQVKGEWAGKPLDLLPWQSKRVIRPMFGKKLPDGRRQYRTSYIEIPRKNGKSTLGAGIALLLLLADDEPGAEIYSCAADRQQAAIIFDIARGMVEANPKLLAKCKLYKRAIVVEETGSAYHVLSADAYSKHGFNPSGIIFDELHAQPNRDLWDVMQTGTGARRQPLTVAITTAGYDKHSICWELHEYAEKVRDGLIDDPSFLPVIYGAPEGADWTKKSVWKKANPSLGKTIKEEYLERECAKAQEVPAYQNTFRRLHLDQWTEQETRWLDISKWEACGAAVDPAELRGRRCFAGLDLSSTTDISALVLFFPGDEEEPSVVLPFFWIPSDNIYQRVRRDRVPYDVWTSEGLIEATDGNVIDYAFIRHRLNELALLYQIEEIAFDRWNASSLVTQLQEDGANLVAFGQGFASMAAPTKELEKLVLEKGIAHGGNPVLRWMASNVSVKQDPAGNLKPDKAKSSERIDGIVALIMALGRHIEQQGPLHSRWEDPEAEMLAL